MIKYIVVTVLFVTLQISYFYFKAVTTIHASLIAHENLTNVTVRPPYYNVCSTFDFNPVTWTLYRKSASSSNDNETWKCRQLYQKLIKSKEIKHIILPDGGVKNLGCTKHTSMCEESAHWDYKRNIRINTPPCCQNTMKEVLRTVTTDLQKHNVSHIVFGGAMLGYARNKQFVPYDNDLDVWMDGKHWGTPLFEEIRHKWTTVDKLYTTYKDNGGKLWVLYSKENGNGLDIWPWYVKGAKVHIAKNYKQPRYDIPKRFIFPLQFTNFSGISTYVPGDPEGYCEYRYGKKWRTEMICTKVERRKCLV